MSVVQAADIVTR